MVYEARRNEPCPCGSGRRYKECHGALGAAHTVETAAAARSLLAQGRRDDALRIARQVIEATANDADGWTVLGLALESVEPDAAVAAWERAVALAPRAPEAHFRIGDFRRRRGEHAPAIAAYEAALAAGSSHPVLLNNLGLALREAGRIEEAEANYRRALEREPRMVEAAANLADLLRVEHRDAEAVHWYTRAAELAPGVASLWLNLGVCQHRTGAFASARASFERALALEPANPQALVDMASAFTAEQRHGEALPLLERAVAIDPRSAAALNTLLYVRQQLCDWREFDRLVEAQRATLREQGAPAVPPHNLLALPYGPDELLHAARAWVAQQFKGAAVSPAPPPVRVDGKLRIGYLGPDFRTHPLANLMTGVIEEHDRSRFEVYGYSIGPDDRSAARARFAAAFDRFFDVRAESVESTAKRIRSDRIAVLLDTSGFVIHARPEIFALRAAPVQVNCVGFPGTLGADFYDYILTDRFVSPPEQRKYFAERFLYLPHCYLPGDRKRPIGPVASRAEYGLLEDRFVFCCFNASYKITPPVFDVWMRLLKRVAGSVLWLLDPGPAAAENLRREAVSRGIERERLVFAPRLPLADHLARHSAADLFLDTLPCNAHTTGNDALFAGLPVLTCFGDTFASRASASQLYAVGLPELVTKSLDEYERLALALAHDRALLSGYRERLRAKRDTAPLFDTEAYTRALESLLEGACAALDRGS
jgi:protein O-GlcNAc transferase